jgi:uncharacterized membrane protein
MSTKGTLVAALAAGLFASAAPLIASAADSAGKVHCEGVNGCQGKGSCHSASNACAGKNGCKGKGWVEMSAKECKDKGGKVSAAK